MKKLAQKSGLKNSTHIGKKLYNKEIKIIRCVKTSARMNSFTYVSILVIFVCSIVYYHIMQYSFEYMCEVNKCPYCYGTDFCDEFRNNNLTFKSDSILDFLRNYISVKNVFYAYYKNNTVVLKKLGHNFELNSLDRKICTDNNFDANCIIGQLQNEDDYAQKILEFLNNSNLIVNSFRVCSSSTVEKFFTYLLQLNKSIGIPKNIFFKNVWTILQLNAEPLLFQLLNSEDDWPVPHYYGACGRIIVEEYCGSNLNHYEHAEWIVRAHLSLQLLDAARNYTFKHPDFRFYLTDITPDNIAVNENLEVSFVDFEDIIVIEKYHTSTAVHQSKNFIDEDNFAFSEIDICASSVSDHNYYAVCKLLLSKDAPWPMMKNGLLHSPPSEINNKFSRLFDLIEECVQPLGEMDRFQISMEIMDYLKLILRRL